MLKRKPGYCLASTSDGCFQVNGDIDDEGKPIALALNCCLAISVKVQNQMGMSITKQPLLNFTKALSPLLLQLVILLGSFGYRIPKTSPGHH